MGNLHLNKKKNYLQGFTVVEIIIVAIIIGILITLSVVAYRGFQDKARETALLSDLDNAMSILEHDFSASGAYPTAIDLADGGNGLPTGSGTTYQYTVNNSSTPPYYCLTGTNGKSSHYIDSTITTPADGACPGHVGAGDSNLALNGLGEYGNNSNFTTLTFDGSDFPVGSQGSFVTPNGNAAWYQSSAFIPIDTTHQYVLRGWARQRTAGITTSRWYFGLAPYDVDNKSIQPSNYMYRPGTTTTLAQPLNTGDTVIHLTNISASWYDVATTSPHYRTFIFWGYTDSTGKTWAPETYSMNAWYTDMYNGGVGAINRTNNTITLNKPWPGASFPAGRSVSNGASGSSYMYSASSNQLVPETWQEWVSPTITGLTPGGIINSVTTFPQGTAKARIVIGSNYGSPPATSRQGYGGIRFYEVN